MKTSLITAHDLSSPRKVDFHFWAEALADRGYQVNFVTVGFSPITFLKKNGRTYKAPFNHWVTLDFNIRKFLWCPIFHPFTLGSGVLDRLSSSLFRQYPRLMPSALLDGFAGTDVFIVENGAGLLLIPALAKKFPDAKIIYSVCDRIETLGYHPVIAQAEKEALPFIDLIRVPADIMRADYPTHPNVRFIPHGLDKPLFDKTYANPYGRSKNAVSVGDMLFDADVVSALARRFPDWTFHLFGRKAVIDASLENVMAYGEKPFAEVIPYIRHADIGLAPYSPAPNADYLSQSSLKMIQYTYCRLPIIAPGFATAGRAHVCAYNPQDLNSLTQAMERAVVFDRASINSSTATDWNETLDAMLEGLEIKEEEIRRAG